MAGEVMLLTYEIRDIVAPAKILQFSQLSSL
jgi:hypothetical protein